MLNYGFILAGTFVAEFKTEYFFPIIIGLQQIRMKIFLRAGKINLWQNLKSILTEYKKKKRVGKWGKRKNWGLRMSFFGVKQSELHSNNISMVIYTIHDSYQNISLKMS